MSSDTLTGPTGLDLDPRTAAELLWERLDALADSWGRDSFPSSDPPGRF